MSFDTGAKGQLGNMKQNMPIYTNSNFRHVEEVYKDRCAKTITIVSVTGKIEAIYVSISRLAR